MSAGASTCALQTSTYGISCFRRFVQGFGIAGAVFVATECSIEKWRARHDIYNSVFGGLTAGAALGAWNKRMGPSPGEQRIALMY